MRQEVREVGEVRKWRRKQRQRSGKTEWWREEKERIKLKEGRDGDRGRQTERQTEKVK